MSDELNATGADVLRFPKGHKSPPDGRLMLVEKSLRNGYGTGCRHYLTQFEVDVDSHTCKCLGCGEKVSSYVVLQELMRLESQWMRTRQAHQDEMLRLKERSRTKCQHCGEMTRISRS